jgi:hypothetical protein
MFDPDVCLFGSTSFFPFIFCESSDHDTIPSTIFAAGPDRKRSGGYDPETGLR